MLLFLYPLEIVSHFLRLLSLAIRLWANLLAGHLLIDFMAGDMAVLLGLPAVGWFTLAPRCRDLPVRVRIDRRSAGIHLCYSHVHLPRWRCRQPLRKRSEIYMFRIVVSDPGCPCIRSSLLLSRITTIGENAGKAIALGVGAGGGAAGAGAGIGMLFGKVIESVTRQPEMRNEITLDPVAGFRPHRGDLLLRPRRRLHRLLPLKSEEPMLRHDRC